MTVNEILADVVARLDSLGVSYAVGGSLSSSVWGQARQTNDIDIAIDLAASVSRAFVQAFGDPYYVSDEEIAEALSSSETYRMVQLMHMEEAFKIDLFLLRNGVYERSELERARLVQIGPGLSVRVSAPENIVLAKLRWYVAGNRISDRQWNDIVQVLEVQAGHLDDAYLDHWAAHFGVRELLDEVRSQALP